MLVNSFALTLKKISARADKSRILFHSQKWRMLNEKSADIKRREWTLEKLKSRCDMFPWNTEDSPQILPAFHGTSLQTAWDICRSGFATLSLLDTGWYGGGIYFVCSTLLTPISLLEDNACDIRAPLL